MLGTLHREFFALIALIFMGLAFLGRHRPRIAGGVALLLSLTGSASLRRRKSKKSGRARVSFAERFSHQ